MKKSLLAIKISILSLSLFVVSVGHAFNMESGEYEGSEPINASALSSLKVKYKGSNFVHLVQSISTELLSNDKKSMRFAVHFDMAPKSVFGKIGNIRRTTEMQLAHSTCRFEISHYNIKKNVNEEKKISKECLKFDSFINTRLTDFQTEFGGTTDRLLGLVADVAVQLIFSPRKVSEVLFKN